MQQGNNKIEATYFFRKPQPQYFSIEKVFELVIANLPDDIELVVYKLKNGTNGWWGRIKALFEAFRNRGTINHITGDVTFLALGLPRKGLVITYHDLESLAEYSGWRFKLIKYLWVKLPVQRAEVITVISEHTKQKIVEWTGVDKKKITVIPNPLPEEITYSPKPVMDSKPIILVVGTKKNKNVERIFEALKDIDCKILLIGKMTTVQQEIIKRLNLEVENLVHLPYNKIVDAYIRCDILCFPSLYEGFGMPIIEAQGTGRPVITSNFGAMKEVAGEGALLVDSYEIDKIKQAVEKLIKDTKLREELIKRGVINVERFFPKKIAFKYSEIYMNEVKV